MRKFQLLVLIGITSLSMMACSFANTIQLEGRGLSLGNQREEESSTFQNLSPSTDVNNDTNTLSNPNPVDTSKICLANTWEIVGLSDYIMAAIPQDLITEYNLQYEDTTGLAYVTLSPDGQITLQAKALELRFSTQAFFFRVPVIVKVDGTAVGSYETDGNTLSITQLDTSGLSASAQAFGEDLIDPNQIIGSIPLTRAPYNTADYTCQGDTLILDFSTAPGNLPPLTFQTVE
ncbi:MAG: hypothetical protein ACK2T5_07325 [Anaerolineales bacterium]|jgi:hypothetical protein